MKQRATLAAAILALVLLAFARCEPPRVASVSGLGQEPSSGDRKLPAGRPDQFSVQPIEPKKPPPPKDPEFIGPMPFDELAVPVRPPRETVHHHIVFGDLDNPHADEDMAIKPPATHVWPMPVLPLVK